MKKIVMMLVSGVALCAVGAINPNGLLAEDVVDEAARRVPDQHLLEEPDRDQNESVGDLFAGRTFQDGDLRQ